MPNRNKDSWVMILVVGLIVTILHLATAHLLANFKYKWSVGQYVRFRERHKRTDADTIEEIAYSTERGGGGTIKVYKLRNKWVGESSIKALMQ